MDRTYRICYFIKRLNNGDFIDRSWEASHFFVNKKTIERDMLRVNEIMENLYGVSVCWDRENKLYFKKP